MGLRHIVAGAAIFTAGVLSSNTVRHGFANFVADERIPQVDVSYSKSGTYVNGEKVDSLGRIGGARCDWSELNSEQRVNYVLQEFHDNKELAGTYIGKLSTQDQMNVAYRALVQLARKAGGSIGEQMEEMKDAVGFRWDLRYTQPE